ncbi:TatD family hydrolase [Geomonas sp. RF6]|uniref:TatD family hydrolase n=1 Tax=Geomonas sp. RF6 TaxID=2897342 RepID=UPI001E477D07|nr:TatD family hydrolase [Geomonas sp. RF6]UFS72305.1 TatD family hydrolase [Geomonas sp. RF6]
MLIDTHCHLDDPLLKESLPLHLQRASSAGVIACVIPGIAPAGWKAILSLSRDCDAAPRLFPAFGVHPMNAHLLDQKALWELETLAPSATAIGEIGLDYSEGMPAREVQQHAFLTQLRLARRHDLPVLIHCRKAFGDLLELLRGEGVAQYRGVMHAFSGSVETALQCVKIGLAISVCGTITYRNAVKPVAVAAEIPLQHLLIETDAPDLPPEPHRGETNLPENLRLTARHLASVKGVTEEEVAHATTQNAKSLFRLPL